MLGKALGYLGRQISGAPRLKRRLGAAGAYLGASSGLNVLIDSAQDYDRAYYGEDNAAAYDQLKGASNFLANTAAVGALFGADPGGLIVGATKDVRNSFYKVAMGARNVVNPKTRLRLEKVDYNSSVSVDGLGVNYSGSQSAFMQTRSPKKSTFDDFKQGFSKNNYKVNKTRMAAVFGGPMLASAAPGIMAGAPSAYDIPAATIGAAAAAPLTYMLAGKGLKVAMTKGGVVGSGAFAGGYVIGSDYSDPGFAEGRITSMGSNGSAVRRMNYSTAGLPLAMHRNR